MGTRGLELVYYHGRYYVFYHQYDSYYEGLGATLVNKIPEDPEEYQKWLEAMRAKYAAKEKALEEEVYTIRPEAEAKQVEGCLRIKSPRRSLYQNYICLPTVLPELDRSDAENVYIINLDAEVLTMNFSVHWRMDRIPRADNLWLQSISSSIYRHVHTVDLDLCDESCLASLAVPLPASDPDSPMQVQGTRKLSICDARMQLDGHDKVWRALVASGLWSSYSKPLERFGRQWYPHDMPFREFVFALVSLSAGRQTAFRSFCGSSPPGSSPSPTVRQGVISCHPHACKMLFCTSNKHLDDEADRIGQEYFFGGDERKMQPPCLCFCSSSHWEDEPPGAAPLETTYWLTDDVLISLTLAVDGAAVTKAMNWGLEQLSAKNQAGDASDSSSSSSSSKDTGRHRPAARFYMVVLSLFNVVFAEVSLPTSVVGGPARGESKQTTKDCEKATANNDENENENENDSRPDIRVSSVLPLSPLVETPCVSTHPRERPVKGSGGQKRSYLPSEWMKVDPYDVSLDDIQEDYPGIVAMVNFMAAIDDRRAAAGRINGHLPPELYARILEMVDYDTWKDCLLVSPLLRSLGLSQYRLDDRYAIVGGPGTMANVHRGEPIMTFELRDFVIDKTETIMRSRNDGFITDYNWVPLVGTGNRQAAILNPSLLFESVAIAKLRKKESDARMAEYRRKEEEKEAAAAAAAGATST